MSIRILSLWLLLLILPAASLPARPENSPQRLSQEATPLSEGWNAIASKDGNIKLALPPGWLLANSQDPNFVNAIQQMVKDNPGMPPVDEGHFYMLAVHLPPKNGFADNLNVIKMAASATTTIDETWVSAVKTELTTRLPGTTDFQARLTPLLGRTALRYQAKILVNRGQGQVRAFVVGYTLVAAGQQYVFTFSTTPEDPEGFAKMADKAMQHLEIVSEAKESAQI